MTYEHIIKRGCGYWDATDYPVGGCFKRAGSDDIPANTTERTGKFAQGYLAELKTHDGRTVWCKEASFDEAPAPRILTCTCCAQSFGGRHWWNLDYGFGLCSNCIELCCRDREDKDIFLNYGVRGYHYGLPQDTDAERIAWHELIGIDIEEAQR